MASSENFQADIDDPPREVALEIVDAFMRKVGTKKFSEQFEAALKIIKILSVVGTEEDKNKYAESLSLIVWAGVVDAVDEAQKAERQQIYKDHPWISAIIATNNPRFTSAPV